jgi:HEAT repeat protein
VSAALLALVAAAAAPAIANARMASRSAAGGLAPAVEAALAAAPGPGWIAYTVPVEARQRICCWDSSSHGEGCCDRCRLEKGEGFSTGARETPVPLETAGTGLVLLRAEGGRVGRVRLFSSDCAVDAGGLPVTLLTDVAPAQSLRLLSGYVEAKGDGRGKSVREGALAAIAHHADAGADDILEGFTRPGRPEHLRKEAAFWLGNARGQRGYEVLVRMMREEPSDDLRAHVTFALSQSEVPEALTDLIRAARRDASAQVRGQALFWLAQEAGDRAAGTITRAIDDDPDTEVKEKAVFALSQLPKEQGVPLLIEVARNHRNREVRKKAMFWLGQSNDERALEFIEGVLTR